MVCCSLFGGYIHSQDWYPRIIDLCGEGGVGGEDSRSRMGLAMLWVLFHFGVLLEVVLMSLISFTRRSGDPT